MGRRHVKEYRPDEALSLITADREGKVLRCPCCGSDAVERTPPRPADGLAVLGRVQLLCAGCTRVVAYIDRGQAAAAPH